ncbi:MAG: aldose epimerase family protein [Verrucomicrobiota bacterium]
MRLNRVFHFVAVSILAGSFCEVRGQSVETEGWGRLKGGEEVALITLRHGPIAAEIATHGAQIVSLQVPDKDGKSTNVVLGYPDLKSAERGGTLGAVIGRYANRISKGGFEIDGERFDLESVNPKTGIQLHGGKTGFQFQNWEIEENPERVGFEPHPAAVTLRLVSPDGHEGFPGNLTVWVQYRIAPDSGPAARTRAWLHEPVATFEMEFRARTDAPTHVNLTNHAYFNLAGEGTIAGHSILWGAGEVLEFDANRVPTGKVLPLESMGLRSGSTTALKPGSADFQPFDHCFVTPDNGNFGALVGGNGLKMSVETSQPGVQIYTANHFNGDPFPRYGGICFETQHFPDTPNQPAFPTTLLRPGEWLMETTTLRFSVEVAL